MQEISEVASSRDELSQAELKDNDILHFLKGYPLKVAAECLHIDGEIIQEYLNILQEWKEMMKNEKSSVAELSLKVAKELAGARVGAESRVQKLYASISLEKRRENEIEELEKECLKRERQIEDECKTQFQKSVLEQEKEIDKFKAIYQEVNKHRGRSVGTDYSKTRKNKASNNISIDFLRPSQKSINDKLINIENCQKQKIEQKKSKGVELLFSVLKGKEIQVAEMVEKQKEKRINKLIEKKEGIISNLNEKYKKLDIKYGVSSHEKGIKNEDQQNSDQFNQTVKSQKTLEYNFVSSKQSFRYQKSQGKSQSEKFN